MAAEFELPVVVARCFSHSHGEVIEALAALTEPSFRRHARVDVEALVGAGEPTGRRAAAIVFDLAVNSGMSGAQAR